MGSLLTMLRLWLYAVLRGILIVTSYPIGAAVLIYYFAKFDILKAHIKAKPQQLFCSLQKCAFGQAHNHFLAHDALGSCLHPTRYAVTYIGDRP